MSGRLDWPAIVSHAAVIVWSYDTGVTLRQLFYRLVSEQVIPNSTGAYKGLSARTAEARRQGTFPALIDRGRQIHRVAAWDDEHAAIEALIEQFRLDRTRDQDVSLYLGVEKAGLVEQLMSWFGRPLGLPILAPGGYSGQTYVDDVASDTRGQDRRAVLLYAGDFDPSGEDIDRDFVARTGCWSEVIRVALTADQVQEYGLPPNPGKATDSRAASFVSRHGELVQVEVDALDPVVLRDLFQAAITQFWDTSTYESVLRLEAAGAERLRSAAAALRGLS